MKRRDVLGRIERVPAPPPKVTLVVTGLTAAIEDARQLAREGPRATAVLQMLAAPGEYAAAPGFMDADTADYRQVALVTPDGRVWMEVEAMADAVRRDILDMCTVCKVRPVDSAAGFDTCAVCLASA